ncbi:type III-B CRISPR module RAMP protein Cmr6 [Desulfofundulus sp. TPOSR]|uniref:type III-B CRISPR module RAMP protein Cmr6 n=1 Tax=Desulfofundulus sp. TPOSR TaxID=2714340 RepID=UPI00140721C3|nr:type III-B CRISPR module RAMP protein Cmr6 [Desulfofundulus sp. TPOSR]NHM27880.1 type III-B CRISPR module RAMP protein Cmr6 [Desulfofundulus sp. TPOSR]
MTEKARLKVQKTKKGTRVGVLEFGSGKTMPLPPFYQVDEGHDGLECEVERENGQIKRVCVRGQELPRKGGAHATAEKRGSGVSAPVPRERVSAAYKGPGLFLSGKVFLPSDTRECLKNQEMDNFGLYLYKAAGYNEKEKAFSFSLPGGKVKWAPPLAPGDFFRLLDERRREALRASGMEFRRLVAELGGRLVVGLGAESVHEVSLTLHPLYGFPYVPASAIKGAVRNAVIRDRFGGREDRSWDDTFFCLVFGHRGQQGKVRFFDAYPLDPPTVVMDVVNPHYVPYYQGAGNMPPGDYYNPVPVFFGAVEKTRLVLYLGMDGEIGKEMGNEPLEKAVEWLGRALSIYGLGAKTALGYGLMFLNDGNS